MTARDPEECDRLFGECFNTGDLDGLLALYEPGCRLVRRDGTVATGHAEIREVLGRLVALRPAFQTRVVSVVAREDVAVVYSDWTMSATPPGAPPIERSGKAMEVVRRQPDGSWRVAIDDPFARG
jgi:uncharacterized protein (TIGR02246 family)